MPAPKTIPKTSGCVKGFARVKKCFGRAGMPQEWIDTLYADYKRLGSLEKVGAAHGRTRQSIYQIFKRAGLQCNPRRDAKPFIIHKGRKYSQDSYGYWRLTVGRMAGKWKLLHHVVWVEHNGPIPPGHDVGFADGNKDNWQIENLFCCEHGEMTRRRATGENGSTKTAGKRLNLLLQNFSGSKRSFATTLR